MGAEPRWTKIDGARLGLVIHEALVRAARGEGGEVDIELGGRWIRIASTKFDGVVKVFEVDAPKILFDQDKQI